MTTGERKERDERSSPGTGTIEQSTTPSIAVDGSLEGLGGSPSLLLSPLPTTCTGGGQHSTGLSASTETDKRPLQWGLLGGSTLFPFAAALSAGHSHSVGFPVCGGAQQGWSCERSTAQSKASDRVTPLGCRCSVAQVTATAPPLCSVAKVSV